MSTMGWITGAALVVVLFLSLLVTGFVTAWRRYHGVRLVTCPETKDTVAVNVDALHAANTYATTRETDLRLRTCTRWPGRRDCGQECLSEIAHGPEECLLRNIVANWYRGKACAVCTRPIGEIVWHERPPALIGTDGLTREWKEIAPEDLPKIFRTHRPLCWNCHIAFEFRREHPELVVDRVPPREPPRKPLYTTNVY
jgi:hypothetical protein